MTDELSRLEHTIGRILRAGVILSAAAMVTGLVMVALAMPQGRPILNGGLILLMMIPSARILVSLVDAIYRRDLLLGIATAIVSGIIIEQVLKKLFFPAA